MKTRLGFSLLVFLLASALLLCSCGLVSGSASKETTTSEYPQRALRGLSQEKYADAGPGDSTSSCMHFGDV